MIISYICVVGDGNYCDFTLSVLMIQFPFLLLIQVKSRVLDQVYMVMIILHVLVLLHDFELSPTRPPLWCLLHRCLFHLYLPTPYHIRCSWWWLLYYIVSIAIMIHVISILKSIFWYNINYHDHFVHLCCWWWWIIWVQMICLYESISILFWFKSSQVKCIGSSLHGDDFTTSYSPTTWPGYRRQVRLSVLHYDFDFYLYVYLHSLLYNVIDDDYYTTSYLLPLWYKWFRFRAYYVFHW